MADEKILLTGVVLLVVGVVLLFIPFVCFVGIGLAIIGFILLLVGAVAEGPRPTVYGYPPAYAPPYQAYPPYPGTAPVGPPVQQAPGAAPPHCPRCGQPLEFAYQYGRWYCRAENVYPWG